MLAQPDATGILNAEHLEELETQTLAAWDAGMAVEERPLLTLADAVETLRRIKYHNAMETEDRSLLVTMLAPLQAQIDQIRAWGKDRSDTRQRSIAFHESRLHAFYRLNPPSKGKTITLPGGKVSCKDPADKWEWAKDDKDDKALIATVKAALPALIHSETVESVNKNEIKAAAQVEDGKVYLVSGDGEKVEIPVRVIPQPATYKVEVE